jgi:hypothetical protein
MIERNALFARRLRPPMRPSAGVVSIDDGRPSDPIFGKLVHPLKSLPDTGHSEARADFYSLNL